MSKEKEEIKGDVENSTEDKIIELDQEKIDLIENIDEKEILNNTSDEEVNASEEVKENKESKMETKHDADKKKKRKMIIILSAAFVLALIILFGIIVCINKLNDKVYKNIYLFGSDMSGKTSEEVISFLESQKDIFKNKKLDIYQGTEVIYTFGSVDIDFDLDTVETAKDVLNFGRNGNLIKDNISIFKALFSKVEVVPNYQYDNEKLEETIKNIDLTIKDRFVDDSYNIDEENKKLVITRGKTGNYIDYDTEQESIVKAFSNIDENKVILEIDTKKPEPINVADMYEVVKREAKDAYIDESTKPIKFVSEIIGIEFNKEEAEQILLQKENKGEGKVIEIPLIITEPKIKIKDITYNYYNDKLSGKTTYFDASQSARANNLNIALRYLNGKIIMPGETFSYNAAIGSTTSSKGYQAAATFKGGTVVMEVGGGICQTSSTLYNSVLMANLEIVQRHQHGLPVGYIPPSLDATVYSPVLDFRFKNNRNYPVKIVTSFSYGGNMNISIYGTKEDNEYDISLSHKNIGTIPFTTKYIYDNNIPEGEQIIEVRGVNGYISEGYITKSQNGKVISYKMLSKDTYKAQQQVVRVGTSQSAS